MHKIERLSTRTPPRKSGSSKQTFLPSPNISLGSIGITRIPYSKDNFSIFSGNFFAPIWNFIMKFFSRAMFIKLIQI